MVKSVTVNLLPLSMALVLISASGCVKRGDNPQDPYEPINRKAFELNQKLDETFFQRPTRMYNTCVPPFIRKSTMQVFHNLLEPRSFVNFLFQKRVGRAMNAFFRFSVNSTLGIGGIADVARSLDHDYDPTDFGVTLAVWSKKTNSPYFYSALTGPSTIRDTAGSYVDKFFIPPYPFIAPTASTIGSIYYSVALRAQLLENQELIESASFDRYVLIRDAYLQKRHLMITGKEMTDTEDHEANVMTAADDEKDADIISIANDLDNKTENKSSDSEDAVVIKAAEELDKEKSPKTKTMEEKKTKP